MLPELSPPSLFGTHIPTVPSGVRAEVVSPTPAPAMSVVGPHLRPKSAPLPAPVLASM